MSLQLARTSWSPRPPRLISSKCSSSHSPNVARLAGALEQERRRALHAVVHDRRLHAAGLVQQLHAAVVGGDERALGGRQRDVELALRVLAVDEQRPGEADRDLRDADEVLDVARQRPPGRTSSSPTCSSVGAGLLASAKSRRRLRRPRACSRRRSRGTETRVAMESHYPRMGSATCPPARPPHRPTSVNRSVPPPSPRGWRPEGRGRRRDEQRATHRGTETGGGGGVAGERDPHGADLRAAEEPVGRGWRLRRRRDPSGVVRRRPRPLRPARRLGRSPSHAGRALAQDLRDRAVSRGRRSGAIAPARRAGPPTRAPRQRVRRLGRRAARTRAPAATSAPAASSATKMPQSMPTVAVGPADVGLVEQPPDQQRERPSRRPA